MKNWNLDQMLSQGCVTRGHVQVRFEYNHDDMTFDIGIQALFFALSICLIKVNMTDV